MSGNEEAPLQGRAYLVGGAVRDGLLGLPVEERDWVVVGSTPQAMRAAGFRQADPHFPVFLHPDTGEEYALARRETKVAGGYRGFVTDVSPAVTLEQDLARRDFTINAMARDAAGELIDPYGGQDDLAEGRLRHVGAAFVEDPVRILRAARFAAKLGAGFRLAHATHRLMRQMVEAGAVAELQPQRIAAEMYKSMACAQPWRFFEVLHACGALADLAPGLAAQMPAAGAHAARPAPPILALRRACRDSEDVDIRLAALLLRSDDPLPSLARRLGLARSTLDLLQPARAALPAYLGLEQAGPAAVHDLLQRMRAWHRAGPFTRILTVLRAQVDTEALSRRLLQARAAAMQVSASALQAQGELQGAVLGEALAQARIRAIAGVL